MRLSSRWLALGAAWLASCGGSDGTSAPTVTLNAGPKTVANAATSTLTWTSTNATACAASGGWNGARGTSGSSVTSGLSAATTFVLSCSGPGGTSAPTSVTVNVVPSATLTAEPTLVASGSPVVLTWISLNATACEASGGWSGAKAASGSQIISSVAANATYSMVCTGPGGSSEATSVTVDVVPAVVLPTVVLTTNSTVVPTGGSAVLSWSSSNATTCTASGGWSGTQSTSGSLSTGALSASTTYSLICSGAGGNSNTASVTIINGVVIVAPTAVGLTPGQPSQFSATAPAGSAVSWSVDGVPGGNATVGIIGSSGLYAAGSAPGTHMIAATSTAYPAISGSAVAAITNLSGVLTYHNDLARDGANTQEFALTPANVSAGAFGKLFSCSVDGAIYGQPLWVPGLTVGGARHNVVFVATEHDGLFAFDADSSPCVQLWQVSLIDAAHGAAAGETTVPAGPTGYLVGRGAGDLSPEVGVTGTPVIDASSSTLYAVSKSVDSSQTTFYQRLHAIDLATGNEKSGAPIAIAASYPGSGAGGASVVFDPRQENERAALALVNGTVYIAWSAHEDAGTWYGWVMGYSYGATGFAQVALFNAAPDAQQAGIWMSGGAPAADSSGNLFLVTGNGTFDATNTTAPNHDYGDSLLELNANLGVLQYFTPSDEAADSGGDKDFGAGGAAILADLPAGSPIPQLLLCGGKDGSLYLLNRGSLGGFGDTVAVQKMAFGYPIFATGAYWNSNFYLSGSQGPLSGFALTPALPAITLSASSSHVYGFGGASPSVSAAGTQNGIVWTVDNANYCTGTAPGCGPAVLYAHDATNVANELWNSSTVAADAAGNAVKFTVPTVANGKVYVATRGNNTGGNVGSSSVAGEVDVYGLRQ